MREPLLVRAAEAIERGAAELKASHTLSNGRWPDHDPIDAQAHKHYDEMMALADECRMAAVSDQQISITSKGLGALKAARLGKSK